MGLSNNKFTSAKAPLWPIFLIIFEQWNNHYISNYQKTSLTKPSGTVLHASAPVRAKRMDALSKLPLSPNEKYNPTDPL